MARVHGAGDSHFFPCLFSGLPLGEISWPSGSEGCSPPWQEVPGTAHRTAACLPTDALSGLCLALLRAEVRSNFCLPRLTGRSTEERLVQMLVLLWVSLNLSIKAAPFVGF